MTYSGQNEAGRGPWLGLPRCWGPVKAREFGAVGLLIVGRAEARTRAHRQDALKGVEVQPTGARTPFRAPWACCNPLICTKMDRRSTASPPESSWYPSSQVQPS